MTTTLTDPWTEHLIQAGRLAPGARVLSRREAAEQYNATHAPAPEDHAYLYTPGQAQEITLAALSMVGIDLPDGTRIVLIDVVTGHRGRAYVAKPGQIEAAVEEHQLCTGEVISADALLNALPWE